MFEHILARQWMIDWAGLAEAGLILLIATILALIVNHILFAILQRLARLTSTSLDEMVFQRIERPVRFSIVAIAIAAASQTHEMLMSVWQPLSKFIVPGLVGWIAYTLVKAFAHALEYRAELADDPVASRSRRTRIAILSRTATFAIIFITVGLMLLSVPGVRDIGTTLLASAGLAALAVGAAAQPALKSLIAGLQMAITEPLRLGDLVVVDGHTGRIEEIRMSFVTVRTWDERAIVVPTSRFLDESFENWSRKSEMLTGPVYLHLDPATEIDPIRQEFLRFLETQEKWDRRDAKLLLTEAYPESIELRLSMSSATIGQLWDLRCAVREHMLNWLRHEMPGALIRHRLEVGAANDRAKGG